MPGTLYVVATPIGNLGDLSPRAASVLAGADFVAAEDTRVTVKLLNHLGLKKPMVSYHRHNARQREEPLLERLLAGESCALCSDAGTPAVSDPGEPLVAQAHRLGIPVSPVPGPSAAIAALCASGRVTGRFVFEGFLPQNRRQRTARLAALAAEERTIIFYEAPHKLPATLDDLAAILGGDRPVTVCRELTKLHEEILSITLNGARAHFAATPPRGEFVLVAAGAPATENAAPAPTLEQAAAEALRRAGEEKLSASEAARRVAEETGHQKSLVYRAMQSL